VGLGACDERRKRVAVCGRAIKFAASERPDAHRARARARRPMRTLARKKISCKVNPSVFTKQLEAVTDLT
jgi:hypothetical protein